MTKTNRSATFCSLLVSSVDVSLFINQCAFAMTLAATPASAFTGQPCLLRRACSRARTCVFPTRGRLVIVAGKKGAKAKNKDSGRSVHFRKGAERFNTGGVGEVQRGGKGSGKTTRSQRTNKVYKTYLSGRPTVDDVERASQGDRTKAMGVVEREAPYRLNRVDREAWERAKKRGGHGFGDGTGGGGVLEVRTTASSALAPHRHPLVNTHRLFCDAKLAAFVVIEKENEGKDDVVVDLSTLRVERDLAIRERVMEIADGFGVSILTATDLCSDLGEPLEAQVRYIRALEADIVIDGGETVQSSEILQSPETTTATPPSPEQLAAAETSVNELADSIRSMKDAGATNTDDAVRQAVTELLNLKQELQRLKDAEQESTPEAVAKKEEEERLDLVRITEEARRTIAELPIHNLPERYLRFHCADRPTAKSLAKAIANEKVYPLVEDLEADDDENEIVESQVAVETVAV